MNKTIQCDGATLAVKTKFVVLSFKPFMFFEKALFLYKNGELLFKVPYRFMAQFNNMMRQDMDVDYYLQLKSEDKFSE
jgi:hypothetical protein